MKGEINKMTLEEVIKHHEKVADSL